MGLGAGAARASGATNVAYKSTGSASTSVKAIGTTTGRIGGKERATGISTSGTRAFVANAADASTSHSSPNAKGISARSIGSPTIADTIG